MIVKPLSRRARLVVGPVTLVALGAVVSLAVASASTAERGEQSFTVRSTLQGKTVLPHRIRWLGIPSIVPAKVRAVEFSIDGKLRWREQRPPYTYANDDNYLMTTWLSPGPHRFTVTAISTDNRTATTTATIRVSPAPLPPAEIAGTWTRMLTKADAGDAIDSAPGRWRLTIDHVGWKFRDPGIHGALVDVVYLAPGVIEARGGIATKLPGPGDEGNVWCDSPFEPVRYRWAVEGKALTITLAGPKRCDGQSNVWAGTWSRS